MSRFFVAVLGAMIAGPIAYVMFDDSDGVTRIVVSLILAVGVGLVGALLFGRSGGDPDGEQPGARPLDTD